MLTLILGASMKPGRASHIAMQKMLARGIPFKAIGREMIQEGPISIHSKKIMFDNIHTISLYLRPENQVEYYDYMFKLQPHRIIFNPGTENPELELQARERGIIAERSCTLVLLSTGLY